MANKIEVTSGFIESYLKQVNQVVKTGDIIEMQSLIDPDNLPVFSGEYDDLIAVYCAMYANRKVGEHIKHMFETGLRDKNAQLVVAAYTLILQLKCTEVYIPSDDYDEQSLKLAKEKCSLVILDQYDKLIKLKLEDIPRTRERNATAKTLKIRTLILRKENRITDLVGCLQSCKTLGSLDRSRFYIADIVFKELFVWMDSVGMEDFRRAAYPKKYLLSQQNPSKQIPKSKDVYQRITKIERDALHFPHEEVALLQLFYILRLRKRAHVESVTADILEGAMKN